MNTKNYSHNFWAMGLLMLLVWLPMTLMAQTIQYEMVVEKTDGTELTFKITEDYPVLHWNYGGEEGVNTLDIQTAGCVTSVPCPDIKRLLTREGTGISDYEVDDVFTVNGMSFKVTSLDPLEVKVSNETDNGPAIDTSTEGVVEIPSSVTGEDGKTYTVTTIGAGAFSNCSSVTSVVIPSSVTTIAGGMDWGGFFGGGAFDNCGLTSLVIPASVTSIGSGAFAGCGKLKSIVVEEGNTKYDSRDNCNAIIRKEDNKLIAGCDMTVVPDGVTVIGECAFKNCGLTSLKLPGSVTSIGQQAFEGCSGLTSVVIPEGVTCIWQGTFNGCSSLTTMTIPKGMKWIGRDTSSGNFWSTFGGCESLTDVYCYAEEAPEVTASVFKESNIANATLYVPTGCKDAYAEAEGWKDFKEIVEMEDLSGDVIDFADENVEAICLENWDSNGDGKLSYEEAAAVTDLGNVFYSKNITSFNELQYFTGLTAIGEMAFHFSNITSVKFPTSLLEIGNGAFDETAIESIDGGVTKNDFVFPNHITTLRGEAFAVNDGIHSVTIPASVTLMEPMCFRQCPNLTSFTIDEANPVYKMVDGWVIENGTKMLFSPVIQTIESLVVPEGITEIARRAGSYYGGVSGVKTVMLPASLKKIGYSAFYNLTKVVSNSTEPAELEVLKVEDRTFYPFDDATFTEATLYVPAGSKDKYLAAEGWKKFAQIVEAAIEEEVIYIPNEEEKTVAVDTSDKSATEVEIFAEVKIDGEKYEVTAIGEGAFENNENLEKVSIPETVESIGDNAFAGCSNLKEIRVYAEEPIKLGSSTAAGTRGEGASTVFAEVDMETCVLYVPAGSKEKYEQAEGWKDFTHIVEMGEIMEITIGKNGKTTFCGDKGLDFSGTDKVKAFIATGFDKTEGIIWMTRVKDVPAQVPVMIKGTAEKTYKVPVTAGGTSYYENMFKGNTTGETITINETSDDGTLTNYYMSGGQFVSVSKSAKIGNNKCYLQLPTNFEAETTGEALSVKIADSGKSSFAAPYDLDFTDLGDDLKAFTATGYDASTTTVWLTRVKKVQKGEGLMLKGKGGVTYTIPSTGVQAAYENMIVGNTGEGITIYETSDDGKLTNYYLKGGTYMKVSGNANIGKNKSYLQLPTYMLAGARSEDAADLQSEYSFAELETESMPIIFGSIGDGNGETTGIRTTDCTDDTDESRAAWYTLGGQRISKPTKPGLYIRNGRKVVIRSTTK